MIPKPQIPTYEDLLWPTLKALENIGGSASIQELSSQLAIDMSLPDELLDALHKDGPQTEVDYRAAWARTHLKFIGAIDNTARGVWTIADSGRHGQSEEQARELVRNNRTDRYKTKKARNDNAPEPETTEAEDDQDWEGALLVILRGMAPDAFERLCQRILRESGFTRVEVTGRSGDGGIDGAGVLRVNLISFHVRFQCKRYAGSVGAREIRDFRGSMLGRADKGLFVTTGAFTREAQREAVRDGTPADRPHRRLRAVRPSQRPRTRCQHEDGAGNHPRAGVLRSPLIPHVRPPTPTPRRADARRVSRTGADPGPG